MPTIAQARRQRRRSMGCTTMAVAASLLSCLLVALLANSILHQPGFLFVAGTTLGTPTTLPVDSSPRPVMTPTPTPTGGHETPPATATTDPRQRPTATPQPVTDPTPTATATSTTIPPTPTPTSIPPTPTVTPVPGAGSIGVTDQGVLEQPNPTLSGCPNGSGCDFADTSVAGSTTISEVCKPGNAYCSPTWQNQTAIEGWVLVTSLNPNGWACSGNTCLTGNGYHCANVSFSVPGSSTINVWCVIYTTSPSSLPPLTIVGIYSGEYLWHNPNTLYGNAGYYETQQDCKNGLNDLANRVGPAWVSSDFASKTAGQIVVRGPSPPHYNSNSWTCNPAVGSNTSSFTVSVAVSYTNGLAFPPANAQAAAQNRLKAAKPAGWTYTKTTTCSPTDSQATGTYTLTTQCGDTGWAVYLWSTTDKAGLAQAVAGDSQSRAIAACEAYPLVKQVTTDACTASGPMPPDWTKITVAVAVPPAPFTASNLNSPAVPIAVTAGLSAPPDDAAILASASLVLLLDGVWLALRSRRVRVLSLPNLDNPDDDEDSDNLEDGDA